jgi:hypothetical protein
MPYFIPNPIKMLFYLSNEDAAAGVPSKFILNHKTSSFAINTGLILCAWVFIWFLVGVFYVIQYIKSKKGNNEKHKWI